MPSFTEFQRASTFVPTAPMTAIVAMTMSPATSAHSITSPPRSSRSSRRNAEAQLRCLINGSSTGGGAGLTWDSRMNRL